MSKTTKRSQTSTGPAVVVFGLDKARKKRAGWFSKDEIELATKAAKANSYHVVSIRDDADRRLAAKLKHGKVHQPGDGLLPIVGNQIFAQLAAVAGVEVASGDGKPNGAFGDIIYRGIPATWDEINTGHLVIAQESPKDGWYEAIVLERTGDRFKVRWRDYPKLPAFERPIICIALPRPTPSAS